MWSCFGHPRLPSTLVCRAPSDLHYLPISFRRRSGCCIIWPVLLLKLGGVGVCPQVVAWSHVVKPLLRGCVCGVSVLPLCVAPTFVARDQIAPSEVWHAVFVPPTSYRPKLLPGHLAHLCELGLCPNFVGMGMDVEIFWVFGVVAGELGRSFRGLVNLSSLFVSVDCHRGRCFCGVASLCLMLVSFAGLFGRGFSGGAVFCALVNDRGRCCSGFATSRSLLHALV